MLTLTQFITSISSFEFSLNFPSYYSLMMKDINFLDESSSHDKNFGALNYCVDVDML